MLKSNPVPQKPVAKEQPVKGCQLIAEIQARWSREC